MDPASVPDRYDGRKVLWSNRRIRSTATVFGEIRYQPDGACGPRRQRDVQLVVVHSGACLVAVDALGRSLPVGWAALFLPGHQEHFRFSVEAETHHTWCAVQPASLSASLLHRLQGAPPLAPCSAMFNHLHAAAFHLEPPLDAHRHEALDQLALALLHEYLAMAEDWRNRAPVARPVDRALRHMEDHLGEADCLAGAHRAAGVSRNALIYQFRDALGSTPARHLWRLRTERGVAMLGDTGLSVSEIAERCGFASPFHFSRLVRRSQGANPTTVREGLWGRR